jgi:alkylated DNA repair dioxygenase AlkB
MIPPVLPVAALLEANHPKGPGMTVPLPPDRGATTLQSTGAITIHPDFVPQPAELFARLAAEVAWDTSMRARHAASFGLPYNYSGVVWPEAPFPEALLPLLERLAERLGYRSNNCLAHYYPDGESNMGFHADATSDLEPGTGIAIVSLGSERTLTFRKKEDKQCVEPYRLPAGSLLYMTPEMQEEWKHAILPDDTVSGARISLTFRRMRML